jgi:HlyD family secretion protein
MSGVKDDLENLRIDKSLKSRDEPPRWATRWILTGIALFLLLGVARWTWAWWNRTVDVEVMRVQAVSGASDSGSAPTVILNATGYIIAAHKIQLASKVVGKVAWIGVEKGDRVRKGQVIVRLEDEEYKAQLQQAKGQLAALEARLAELLAGSRPEEIAVARANLDQARAELENARVSLDRTRRLVEERVLSQQALDDAQARYNSQAARVASLEKTYELVRIGPRREQIDQVRGQILQAKGAVAFYETQLENTVIRAPVDGTILERVVEIGEFVTTSFVGERGAKGYVVSMADLNDLQVELDINQNDFAKLNPRQKAIITTDAYPDRKYQGVIQEISPEANRQKATVQVKVQVLNPDEYLRPEMNASVAFVTENTGESEAASARPLVFVPLSAVKDGAVFVVLNGKAVRRPVRTGGNTPQGLRVEDGLIGGEDLIVNPPPTLKDGDKVRVRQG